MRPLYTCPRDGAVLVSCSQNVSAFRCTMCQGLLIDLDKSKSAPLRKLEEFDITGESQLKCPADGSIMSRVVMMGVEIDVNFSARMVWLDYNEYEILTSKWLNDTDYKPHARIPDVDAAKHDAMIGVGGFAFSSLLLAMKKMLFRA